MDPGRFHLALDYFRSILPWKPRCGIYHNTILGCPTTWGQDTEIMFLYLFTFFHKFVSLCNDLCWTRCPWLQQRPNDYGIPVAVEVTYVQDNFLTSDVLNEMVPKNQLKLLFNAELKHTVCQEKPMCIFLLRCYWLNTTERLLTWSSLTSTGVLIRPWWTKLRWVHLNTVFF